MLRNYLDGLYVKTLVEAGVMGDTSTGTTGVDMKGCRSGCLVISYTDGTDTITDMALQDSPDNSTFTTHTEVADSVFTATGLTLTECDNLKRYVRLIWTKSASTADTYWSVQLIGKEAQKNPVS